MKSLRHVWGPALGTLPRLRSLYISLAVLTVACVGAHAGNASQVESDQASQEGAKFPAGKVQLEIGPETQFPSPFLFSVEKTVLLSADPELSLLRVQSELASSVRILGVNKTVKLIWDPNNSDNRFKLTLEGAQGAVLTGFPDRWEWIEVRGFFTDTGMKRNGHGEKEAGSMLEQELRRQASQQSVPNCPISGKGLADAMNKTYRVYDLTVVIDGKYANVGRRPRSFSEYPYPLETISNRSALEEYASVVAELIRNSIRYKITKVFDADSGCAIARML
jgi:hypothetical protein